MKSNDHYFGKIFALILVGLLAGTSLTVVADLGKGDEEEGEYGVILAMEDHEKRIAENEVAFYWGHIKNIGEQDDNFTIRFGGKDYGKEGIAIELFDGLAETDILLPLDGLFIRSGDEQYFRLEISFSVGEGSYEISMMVQSESDEDVWDAEKTVTTVVSGNQQDYDFEIYLHEDELTTTRGIPVMFMMTLANTGDIENTYTVTFEFDKEYNDVYAYLSFPDTDGIPGQYYDMAADELEIYLAPGDRILFALQVLVTDPYPPNGTQKGDDDNDETFQGDGSEFEVYIIHVLASGQSGPEILKSVTTSTIIREPSNDQLSFMCYDTEETIVKGGVAEYFLYLSNYGWSPVDFMIHLNELPSEDIEVELFLVAPYWILEYDEYDPTDPDNCWSTNGLVYDENGNLVYLKDDDILWDDYGGLIPVENSFNYTIYPYETVQFLLRVTHLYDEEEDGDVTITLYSIFYDVGVTVVSNNDYHETIWTMTEVVFNPRYEISMWTAEWKKVTRPFQPVEYVITLKNSGNVESLINLSIGGEAYGLFGVSVYMYLYNNWYWDDIYYREDWEWDKNTYPVVPTVIYNEDGYKEFYNERYEEYEWWDMYDTGYSPEPMPPIMPPEDLPDELQVTLGAGEEIQVILWVMIEYETGTYEITVEGEVANYPETVKEIATETTMKEIEYIGFEMHASVTEQTAFPDEVIDYYISIYNPGYYTDKIQLEIGGKDVNLEGVNASLYLARNVYYYDSSYAQFLEKENTNVYMEYNGVVYNPSSQVENVIWGQYPEYDDQNIPWDDPNDLPRKEYANNEPLTGEEYFFDDTGGIYKNYDYDYIKWEESEYNFNGDEWLIPLVGDDRIINLGPFETVWLVLRVQIQYEEGDYNIDVNAQSLLRPEYNKIVSTETHMINSGNFDLDLFIGDPEHYTAYGVTTVYVFQLTNTGDVRDMVLLEVEGEDANDPQVYVEISVNNGVNKEPVYLRDKYDNLILPYDEPYNQGDAYIYRKWSQDTTEDPGTDPFEYENSGQEYEKWMITADGQLLEPGFPIAPYNSEGDPATGQGEDDYYEYEWITASREPILYGYKNWDIAGDPEYILNEINYVKSDYGNKADSWYSDDKDDQEYFDLDCGFIPYPRYGEKYVELEPGETVIVTMKVTVFNWYWDWLMDYPEGSISGDDADESQNGYGNEKEKENESDESTQYSEEEKEREADTEEIPPWNGSSDMKDIYEITLVAQSKRSQDTRAEAKTITHIYDDPIQEGIWNGRISGVFNVHDTILTKEILELGFEILPLEFESGKIEVKVSGNFSEGRLIVININDSNLQELGEFEVLFDTLEIKKMTLDEIINYQGSDAVYAIQETEDGIQILVYIPHFSEHTISIHSIEPSQSEDSEFSGSLLIMGLVIGVTVGMVGIGYRQRKKEEQKKEIKLKLYKDESKKSKLDFNRSRPITKAQETTIEAKVKDSSLSPEKDDLDDLLDESLFLESFQRKD